MPTRIWLMRHAETASPDVFHGAESDVGLSERGVSQTRGAASTLAGRGAAAVVSSAMRRAIDTAKPIAEACSVRLQIEPDLHERRVGLLGGLPTKPEHPLWTETVRRWSRGDTAFATEGAESFDAIRTRVLPVWNRLAAEFADRSLIVVAHGIVCRVLLLSILPGVSALDWQQFGPIRNLAISELVHDGAIWRAESVNAVPGAVSREA
jgi:2,3-bisphosphoglycerate-dependent phosphoglycerate mutase